MPLVEEVDPRGVESAPLSAEHAFPHVAVVLPASVEPLLRAVVDAGDPLTGQKIPHSKHRLLPFRVLVHESLVRPGHLVMVVHERDEVPACLAVVGIENLEPFVAIPQRIGTDESFYRLLKNEIEGKVQCRVERREALIRTFDPAVSADVALQRQVVSHDLAEDEEILFADALSVFPYGIAEKGRDAVFHMLHRVHPESVDVSRPYPVLVRTDERTEHIGPPDVQFLEAEEVPVHGLVRVAPVPDLSPSLIAVRALEFLRPDRVMFLETLRTGPSRATSRSRTDQPHLSRSSRADPRDRPSCLLCG